MTQKENHVFSELCNWGPKSLQYLPGPYRELPLILHYNTLVISVFTFDIISSVFSFFGNLLLSPR